MTIIHDASSLSAHPPYLHADYASTRRRAPLQPLVVIPHTLSELTGPVYGHESVRPEDADLTRQHAGEPLGERIVVDRPRARRGRAGPCRIRSLEIWQANAAGRYIHVARPAIRPPSTRTSPGAGRVVTDAEGRYRFTTVKPGAYPWRNHPNAWRPAHIHLSLFGPSRSSPASSRRCISPATRSFAFDPIMNVDPGRGGPRQRLVSRFDLDTTEPEWGARLPSSTSCCAAARRPRWRSRMTNEVAGKPLGLTPSQTVGPFFAYVLTPHDYPEATRPLFSTEMATADAAGERIRIEGYVLDGDGEPIIDALIELWQADGEGAMLRPHRSPAATRPSRGSAAPTSIPTASSRSRP